MRKLLSVGVVGLVGLVLLVFAVLLALPYITNLETVRVQVAAAASDALQHPVTIARLGLRALPSPGLQLEDLAITERDGLPIVNVKTIVVEVKFLPLLQRRLDIARIIVGQPHVSLIRNADASLNLPLPASAPVATPPKSAVEGGGQQLDVSLRDVRVKDGELTVRERQKPTEPPLLHLRKVDVDVSDLSVRGKTKDDFNRSLTGTVHMEVTEGAVGNLHTLAQILSLLEIKQLFSGKTPDLSRQTIPIKSLTGTFGFKNGLMTTNDLKLQSPVLDAAVKGTFNVSDKRMKMVVTAMGLDFDVQGTADNPRVSSRAMTGLKEGVGGLVEKGLGLFRKQ
jgi:uncharacterized protein involved in outer membrane biogenesis